MSKFLYVYVVVAGVLRGGGMPRVKCFTLYSTLNPQLDTGMVHSVRGWTRDVHERWEIPWERVQLNALEVCSRRGAIQIHVYLYLYLQCRLGNH